MRRLLLLVVALSCAATAQEYQKGTATTQQTPVGFGMPVISQGRTLYVTGSSPFYLRDSSGQRKAFDTTVYRPYAGAVGACSNEIGIENISNSVQPTSRVEISYHMTATDTSQDRVRFRIYSRNKTPTGLVDTLWRAGQSLWDSVPVILTHTPPQVPSTSLGISWGHAFGFSGQYAKVCIERVDVGSGDTVAVSLLVLRGW